jgi:YbbR domain-containing protein
MGNFLRHLWDNLGSAILALLLAVAVWIAATLQGDPFVDEVIANIPIALLNQADNTVLLEEISDEVSVEVRAPESIVLALQISDFGATMDLAGVESGTPTPITVQVSCTNEAVRLQNVDPAEQTVYLEAINTITLPVVLQVDGKAATGYYTSPPRITPDQVVIHGPDSYLTQVMSVTGSISFEEAKEDISEQVVVTPRDANGRLVSGVEWAPAQVTVDIRVRRRVGFKPEVEVVPDLHVTPAEGYRLGNIEVEPSVVTLRGPASVLDQMPGFVETLPISVSGATQNLVEHQVLTVPSGVAVVGVNFVTVTVEVLPIQSSRTMTAVVELVGVPEGWLALASPDMVDVILEGPDASLSQLTSNDIQILVNVYDLSLGVHRIEPIVLAPEEVTVVSVIPETIEVVLEKPQEPISPTLDLPVDPPGP